MPKPRTRFLCQECGAEAPKWLGRCPACSQWNTMTEVKVSPSPRAIASPSLAPGSGGPRLLAAIDLTPLPRRPTGLAELDRVLGGGLVPGSLVLMGGEPGIGKSTLLLQAASSAAAGATALYASAEESEHQVKLRAERLGLKAPGLYLLAATGLEEIMAALETVSPRLAVVDSIQTIYDEDLGLAPGSLGQVRHCALRLMRWAKSSHVPIFLVGHVTKEGGLAGPKDLEHLVDVVLSLEGERFSALRLLRGVKNRFGSINEIGVFQMEEEGLVPVANPSEAFLAERVAGAVGSAVAPVLEGSRPLLVEVQALTSPTAFGNPRRTATGLDISRLLLVTAVLQNRAGLSLGGQDIIASAVGGLRVVEPAADLALALAIASSLRGRPVAAEVAALAEVGLTGELRWATQAERRLMEAARLGFTACLVPPLGRRRVKAPAGLKLLHAATVGEALALGLAGPPPEGRRKP